MRVIVRKSAGFFWEILSILTVRLRNKSIFKCSCGQEMILEIVEPSKFNMDFQHSNDKGKDEKLAIVAGAYRKIAGG